jgi:hypothetical protein
MYTIQFELIMYTIDDIRDGYKLERFAGKSAWRSR